MKVFYIQKASKEITERVESTGNWTVNKEECELPTEENSYPVCAESAGLAFNQFAKEAEEVVLTEGAANWDFTSGIYHIWVDGGCMEDLELVTTAELVRRNLFDVFIATDSHIWK